MIPIALGIIYTVGYLWSFGYLPQPFFYEPSGTFMDFAAAAEFAHMGGAFDTFATIYPPLTFAVLKLISWGPCYNGSGSEWGRDCDVYGVGWLVAIYFLNVFLIFKTYRKLDRRTSLPRAFAMSFGLPMPYALERGNILLLCFTCLILAYGPLVRSARLRWLFAGLAVNFKVYLIGTVFGTLLRRKWLFFEGAVLASILVYLLSYVIVGEGSFREIYTNITSYADQFHSATVLDLWYPSSIIPMQGLLDGSTFPILNYVGSDLLEWAPIVLSAIMSSVVLAVVLAALATWWRPEVVPMHRLVLLTIGLAVTTSEAGGYTQMLVLFFVFMEPWRGFGRILALVLAYLLCIPGEIPISYVPPVVRDSYFAGHQVVAEYAIGPGVFLRPIFVCAIVVALSWVTIRDVLVDVRKRGWTLPKPTRAAPGTPQGLRTSPLPQSA